MWRAIGPHSAWWSLAAVWLPMTALGTVSHVWPFHLPPAWHRLRGWEVDGRRYEQLGVRLAKRLLRRGPFALFNPGLHLPRERTPAEIARLEQRMMVAEATHAVLGWATLAAVAVELALGWWWPALWLLAFDLVVNVYPVMLQRYNRVLLHRRFAAPPSTSE